MKRLLVGLLCMMFSGLVLAAGPQEVRKRIEASMLVTGSIDVAPDGSVHSYALDKQDKLPPEVVDLLHKAIPGWHFQPVLVDGAPVIAHAKMSVRVVAKREENGDYTARVTSSNFGEQKTGEGITLKSGNQPRYPRTAIHAQVAGTVYLLLRVGRDGQVTDVSAEQVNMSVVASDSDLRLWRKMLADVSQEAAREWTYNTPTTGPRAKDDAWIIRVPVTFRLHKYRDPADDDYGKWQAYVPGPKETISWLDKYPRSNDSHDTAADAVPDGKVYLVGSGLTLTTPIDPS
jgi:hypothetical protein